MGYGKYESSLMLGPIPWYSVNIHTSKITIINRHTLPVLMVIWNGLRLTNGSAGCAHLDV